MESRLNQGFFNVYNDKVRAEAYDRLEFPGTYYLAYRDLPAIISNHAQGRKAIDFGGGTGRSTRFLRTLGFDVVGVDISEHMLTLARKRDPDGEYRLVADGNLDEFAAGTYDLVLSAFTFDNIPTMLDVDDSRPVEDIIWMDQDYHETYKLAGLVSVNIYRPVANQTEPYNWVSEAKIAPWVIYVLRPDEVSKIHGDLLDRQTRSR